MTSFIWKLLKHLLHNYEWINYYLFMTYQANNTEERYEKEVAGWILTIKYFTVMIMKIIVMLQCNCMENMCLKFDNLKINITQNDKV